MSKHNIEKDGLVAPEFETLAIFDKKGEFDASNVTIPKERSVEEAKECAEDHEM